MRAYDCFKQLTGVQEGLGGGGAKSVMYCSKNLDPKHPLFGDPTLAVFTREF